MKLTNHHYQGSEFGDTFVLVTNKIQHKLKREEIHFFLAVVHNREIFGDPWYGILVFDMRGVGVEETNIRSVGVICIF